jgi:hypothetical protein
MQTTLRLDDELYRQAKAAAAEQGVSLTRLVEEAIRECLSRATTPTPRRQRLRLPVATATGGLVPEFSSLQEAVEAADLAFDSRQTR